MRTLTKSEAMALARSGTKFVVGGRELAARDIMGLPVPQNGAKKQGILARFAEQLIVTLRDGLSRLIESHDMSVRTQAALLETMVGSLREPAKGSDHHAPVTWQFNIKRDTDGRITSLTATPKT